MRTPAANFFRAQSCCKFFLCALTLLFTYPAFHLPCCVLIFFFALICCCVILLFTFPSVRFFFFFSRVSDVVLSCFSLTLLCANFFSRALTLLCFNFFFARTSCCALIFFFTRTYYCRLQNQCPVFARTRILSDPRIGRPPYYCVLGVRQLRLRIKRGKFNNHLITRYKGFSKLRRGK